MDMSILRSKATKKCHGHASSRMKFLFHGLLNGKEMRDEEHHIKNK